MDSYIKMVHKSNIYSTLSRDLAMWIQFFFKRRNFVLAGLLWNYHFLKQILWTYNNFMPQRWRSTLQQPCALGSKDSYILNFSTINATLLLVMMQKHKPTTQTQHLFQLLFYFHRKGCKFLWTQMKTMNSKRGLVVSEHDLQLFTFTCLTGFLPWRDLKSCLFVVYLLVCLH